MCRRRREDAGVAGPLRGLCELCTRTGPPKSRGPHFGSIYVYAWCEKFQFLAQCCLSVILVYLGLVRSRPRAICWVDRSERYETAASAGRVCTFHEFRRSLFRNGFAFHLLPAIDLFASAARRRSLCSQETGGSEAAPDLRAPAAAEPANTVTVPPNRRPTGALSSFFF